MGIENFIIISSIVYLVIKGIDSWRELEELYRKEERGQI